MQDLESTVFMVVFVAWFEQSVGVKAFYSNGRADGPTQNDPPPRDRLPCLEMTDMRPSRDTVYAM